MDDDAKMMYPWWGGRTVFTASGLSTEGGSGDAWGFDAAGTCSQDDGRLRRLRRSGCPGSRGSSTARGSVGPNDGSGASVSLSPDGLASLSYYDPTRDPWNCVRSAPDSIVEPRQGARRREGSVAVPEPAIVDPPARLHDVRPGPDG